MLDTNVVLDWLLFADPHGVAVGDHITSGRLGWIATSAMLDEHFAVVARASLQRWLPDIVAQRATWERHCRVIDPEDVVAQASNLRCSDPADQMFVDFALSERPAWLLSRDRALLALAPALLRHGVVVATPAAWAREHGAAVC